MSTPEPLPALLLADPQFTAACASRNVGVVFQLARRAGIGPAQIARRTGLGVSRVSEILTGGRTVSSMDVVERIADGLRIPGHMVGLATRPWETPPAPAADQPATAPQTWEVLDMLTRSTASDAALLHLEAAVADTAYRYPATPPAQSVSVLTGQLAGVHGLLGRPQALGARRRCVRILAVVAGLLGLANHDLGDRARSDAMFHLGRVAAEEGEAPELSAWLLTMQSITDYTSGRHAQAADLLARADQLAEAAAPRRRAWVAANLGRALAARGDRAGALSALDRATALLHGDLGPPPAGLDFFTAPRLDGLAGEAYARLGDHAAATSLLKTALRNREQADVKGRAMLTYDLAECRLGQGDIDEACALAHRALDMAGGTVVRPLVLRARAFQTALAPWQAAGPVRELGTRVRESEMEVMRA
ncbi:helix-turn-helix domain-containing protein [Kitasatospora sp. NPDC004240]